VIPSLTALTQSHKDPIFTNYDALSDELLTTSIALALLGKLDKTFLEDVWHLCSTVTSDPDDSLELDFDDDPPKIDYDTLPDNFDSWDHVNGPSVTAVLIW